ncbi:hypothetical protein [Rhodococcus wratislaviensis]|uniref:hypothetical protein n=1 Tax=Rhodococcus wratislaviensis TaxID=44752 RepID=UPI0004B9ACFA|nr:hypothetical protein [Rhodococcus wratislaviensis]
MITPRTAIVVPATLSFSVFAIPHFYNHLHRLTGSTTFEAIALTSLNLLVAALGITIILVTSLRDQRDRRRNVTIPDAETS